MRTGLLVTAGWLTAAVAASAVSWSAVTLARSAVVGPKTVVQTVGDGSGLTSVPSGTPSPQPARRGAARTDSGRPGQTGGSGSPGASSATSSGPMLASGIGGTATFHCVGSTPVFLNVVPHLGFTSHQDDSRNGEVRFENSTHRTDILAWCTAGLPHWSRAERDTTSGGGGGGGGGNSGKGGGGSD